MIGFALLLMLTLSWTDNTANTAFTRVERRAAGPVAFTGYAPAYDAAPGETTFVDVLPVEGETYCYRAFAYLAEAVSPYSDEACGTVPVITPPPPPPTCRERGKSGKCK